MRVAKKAENLARYYHVGQINHHNGEDYTLHLERVAKVVHRQYDNSAMTAAAWLHDIIEDTSITRDQLHTEVGPSIGRVILRLTRLKNQTTEEYYDQILSSGIASKIKVIDIMDNISRVNDIANSETRQRLSTKYAYGLSRLRNHNGLCAY